MVQWIDALAKTRRKIVAKFNNALNRTDFSDPTSLEDLEEALLGADVAPRQAMVWIEEIGEAYKGLRVKKVDVLGEILMRHLQDPPPLGWTDYPRPATFLIVGVNGSGKTTTCAKLARVVARQGFKPLLGATDTFRAAGAEQLRLWSQRLGCDAVVGEPGADAAAVAYDALDAAVARKADFLFVDTAGRMHTKQPLMNELKKVSRSLGKRVDHAPDEVWVVLDASMGQNAIMQARVFHEATPLTGAVVSKLDGSAKAGFIFSIQKELGVPVRMVGLGEGIDDLVAFDPRAFVNGLLAIEGEEAVR
jgi:fused signal recognition particle receptor